jgi:hypothetical protein
MRANVTTDWTRERQISNFLATQALDFLMTEDDNYIVLQDSYSSFADWNRRPTIITNWN